MKYEEYETNRHACYKLEYHLVVVTKYRREILVDEVRKELIKKTYEIFEEMWGLTIRAVNTDKDHIHVLFSAPPQVQLSKLINNYKTVTSRFLRKKHEAFLASYYWKPLFWSDSYFIGAVSDVSEEIVQVYIERQGQKKEGR